jgi:DNA-binding transcriptional MerR regulator
MDKSPEAFRTISEVAETLDVPPHVLRFWESRFAQVKPVKRGGGRRYYRPEDVRLLRGIRGLLYDDGMTIKGVQKILRERGVRHVIGLGTLPGVDDAAAPAAAPAPAAPARRAAARAGANGRAAAASQADLFAGRPAGAARPHAGPAAARAAAQSAAQSAAQATAPARAKDRAALRALVAELEALRAAMASDRPG